MLSFATVSASFNHMALPKFTIFSSDKSGVTLATPSFFNKCSLNVTNSLTSSGSSDSTIRVVIASSPGAKLSSNNSKPTRDSISSGNDLIKLKEYSFVVTFNETSNIKVKINEPSKPGRLITVAANLCQNP